DEAIARATAAMRGDVRIDLDASTATRTTTATFEEGAFGKGYALDRAVEILRARGVRRAAIDFGGQIVRYGFDAPAPLGIAHPEDRARAAVEIVLADGSVSTSSGSEKTFGDGRYSHIVDPRTGIALPPRGSVTVVHPSALAADVFSTALYVLGPVEGRAWADRHEVAAIWLVPDPPGSYRIVASRAARSRSPTPVDPYFT
ncbi:MAG: FAD:protein FMN transferase, partial [Thermoanaerobaculia bacterium]